MEYCASKNVTPENAIEMEKREAFEFLSTSVDLPWFVIYYFQLYILFE